MRTDAKGFKLAGKENQKVAPTFDRSEGFHGEPRQKPAQDRSEGKFREAVLRQVEADAVTSEIPALRAKQGVG
jgi:hypothetical protein